MSHIKLLQTHVESVNETYFTKPTVESINEAFLQKPIKSVNETFIQNLPLSL